MGYLIVIVYDEYGIEVFGPWDEARTDAEIVALVDSRDEQPKSVYLLTLGEGVKAVREWKGVSDVESTVVSCSQRTSCH
jgi:hypothetical protein